MTTQVWTGSFGPVVASSSSAEIGEMIGNVLGFVVVIGGVVAAVAWLVKRSQQRQR